MQESKSQKFISLNFVFLNHLKNRNFYEIIYELLESFESKTLGLRYRDFEFYHLQECPKLKNQFVITKITLCKAPSYIQLVRMIQI